jgi:hypothetical protein
MPYVKGMTQLRSSYEEAVILEGVIGKGEGVLELWRTHDGDTWTVTMTYISERLGKVLCLLAEGTDLTPVIWLLPGIPL